MSAIGTVLGDKYRILKKIGEGGMGSVYHAENIVTGKQVALKQMHAHLAANPKYAARFLLEARAAARLQHPNVLDIYDIVQTDSAPFLVMELLQGETLRDFLLRNRYVTLPHVLGLLLPALQGVAAAHASGVIHRDLKPDNIFLARSASGGPPIAKVVDFGIARLLEHDGEPLTQQGATLGTLEYMSLEQLRGADIDARADQYAFGVLLYELIAGRLPHEARSLPELIIKVATTEPPRLGQLRPDLPPRLASAIDRAIARDRDQRWPSLRDLADELEPFAREQSYGGQVPRLGGAGPLQVVVPQIEVFLPAPPAPPASDTFVTRERTPRRPTRKVSWIGRISALVGLVAWGWGMLPLLKSALGGGGTQQSATLWNYVQSSQALLQQRSIRATGCLIDANGDEILDVVGNSGFSSPGPLLILDGKSGKELWSGGSYQLGAPLFCPTRDVFVANDKDSFTVSIRASRQPDRELSLKLSDKAERWYFGSDCAAIVSADQVRHEVSLLDGSHATCKGKVKTYDELPSSGWRSRSIQPRAIERGGDTYRVVSRRPGTPVLTASSEGAHDWKVELPFQDADPPFVLSGDALVFAGRPVEGTDKGLHLIGIDAQTGRVLYERSICARMQNVTMLEANGPYVVLLEIWTGVWSFDAQTGRTVWHGGGC